MVCNPSPEVALLREYSRKFDCPIVVAFTVRGDGERFEVVSYGADRVLSDVARNIGEQFSLAVENGTIKPPMIEGEESDGKADE